MRKDFYIPANAITYSPISVCPSMIRRTLHYRQFSWTQRSQNSCSLSFCNNNLVPRDCDPFDQESCVRSPLTENARAYGTRLPYLRGHVQNTDTQVGSLVSVLSRFSCMVACRFISCCIFSSEMANGGRPLFPGNDIDDQLRRIFKYPLMKFKPFLKYCYPKSLLLQVFKYCYLKFLNIVIFSFFSTLLGKCVEARRPHG